jgi:hypothetical protein
VGLPADPVGRIITGEGPGGGVAIGAHHLPETAGVLSPAIWIDAAGPWPLQPMAVLDVVDTPGDPQEGASSVTA